MDHDFDHAKAVEFAAGNGKVEALLHGKLSFKQAMKPSDVAILGCMDDGVEEAAMRAAGGLILMPLEKAVRVVREAMKNLKLRYVGYHGSEEDGGCGAVAKYLRDVKHIDEPTLEQIIEAAKSWAEELAAEVGLEAKEMVLDRPLYHLARAIYFDGTGKMTNTKGLPRGFVISRLFLPREYALSEVVTAVDIAMSHGFNHLFCEPHPLVLVAVGSTKDQANELREELEHAQTMLTQHERENVKIISVVA